jgi:cytochrome c oxidase assembly protein subunit 15
MTPKPRPVVFRLPSQKPTTHRHLHRLAWLACALAFCVIVFGAFVRLSNAGLSCPDWPTCYGRAAWPSAPAEVADHVASQIRPFDATRAWREQVHRMLAGTLGVLVLLLAVLAARQRRHGIVRVVLASLAVAASIPLYMRGMHGAAMACAIAGELLLLANALQWSRQGGAWTPQPLPPIASLTLAVIVFQALLGMWTVTWLLKPIVVMGHLLGGLATFALLAWLAWRATDRPVRMGDATLLRRLFAVGLVLLVALKLLRSPGLRGFGGLLGTLLLAQVALGVANVKLALPLKVAVLHNAGAALLLFVLVTLLSRVRAPEARPA